MFQVVSLQQPYSIPIHIQNKKTTHSIPDIVCIVDGVSELMYTIKWICEFGVERSGSEAGSGAVVKKVVFNNTGFCFCVGGWTVIFTPSSTRRYDVASPVPFQ